MALLSNTFITCPTEGCLVNKIVQIPKLKIIICNLAEFVSKFIVRDHTTIIEIRVLYFSFYELCWCCDWGERREHSLVDLLAGGADYFTF